MKTLLFGKDSEPEDTIWKTRESGERRGCVTMAFPVQRNSKDPAGQWTQWGIPVVFLLSGLMHFVYAWSGNQTWVGMLAPVNESVWEHQKLAFLPLLFWWATGYAILRKRLPVSPGKWFIACAVAEMICPLFIISFFYTKTGAFGVHSLFLDIASLLIALVLAQWMGRHVLRYAEDKPWLGLCGIFLLVLLALALVVFTFTPPKLPLFMDSLTGRYGI
jgi:hypothetical protein